MENLNTTILLKYISSNINNLTVKDIEYLQASLESIKKQKIAEEKNKQIINAKISNSDWNNSINRSNSKKELDKMKFGNMNCYKNPYEIGSKQNSYGMIYMQHIDNSEYDNEKFPGCIRNVNVESSLLQSGASKMPGQRNLTQCENNRFAYTPFCHRNAVWNDDMPRGGYATRAERQDM